MTQYKPLDGDDALKILRKAHKVLVKIAVHQALIDLIWPNKLARYIVALNELFYRKCLCRTFVGYGKREWQVRPAEERKRLAKIKK